MVIEGIVLGPTIFVIGLEVDQVKVYVIENMMQPITIKEIRSFWDLIKAIMQTA